MRKTFINIKRGDTIYFIDRYENIKKYRIHKTIVTYIHEGKKHNTIMIYGHKYGFRVNKEDLSKNIMCYISLYHIIVLSPSLWKIRWARKQLIEGNTKDEKNNN